jgi:predicted transcriptional regulator
VGKLDSLHIKDNVVKKLAVGQSQASIANQVGVNQSTISRFASKDEAKAPIEEEQEKLVKIPLMQFRM